MLATVVSPVTFTAVRHISRGLSRAMIRASPSSGIPTAPRTITSITSPAPGTAAAPMDESVAVRTMVSCCVIDKSIPYTCAINTAETAWCIDVPSILMVAPSGNTNEDTFSDTPSRFSAQWMVTGNVDALELVLKANNCAGKIAFRKFR